MVYYVGSIPCMPTDLKHHGILGMKWGIRRFQNPDGSLTPAGRSRYGGFDGTTRGPERAERPKYSTAGPDRAERPKYSTASAIEKVKSYRKNTVSLNRNLRGERTSQHLKDARKKNVDEMSDQELQKEVNRLNLEKSYRNLTKRDTSAAEKWLKGTALTILTAAVVGLGTDALKKGIKKGAKFVRKFMAADIHDRAVSAAKKLEDYLDDIGY